MLPMGPGRQFHRGQHSENIKEMGKYGNTRKIEQKWQHYENITETLGQFNLLGKLYQQWENITKLNI